MNLYIIELYNKKKNIRKTQKVKKITFPEAVLSANMTRNTLGFDWEIIKISKKENKKRNKDEKNESL